MHENMEDFYFALSITLHDGTEYTDVYIDKRELDNIDLLSAQRFLKGFYYREADGKKMFLLICLGKIQDICYVPATEIVN